MDRRTFLTTAGAASIAAALPAPAAQMRVGIDIAPGPSQTAVRLLSVQRGAIREVHRVMGVPRYILGADGSERDTWMEQVNAGESAIIEREAD